MSMYENFILLRASSQLVHHVSWFACHLILVGIWIVHLRACNSYILFTSFGSQNPPGFYTMRSKCSPHCIHTTIYIIVGNLNNSTIFTYLWLTRSLASMATKNTERLIFCHFRPLTLNSTRMCFYHVLKRISTSLSQVVFQAISNLIKNWKK